MRIKHWYAVAGLVGAFVLALAVPGGSAPGEPTARFTAAGDYGTTADARAVFARIGELHPDANFVLGDLSYAATGTEQSWCDMVVQGVGAGFPFELLAGNHESNGPNGNINDFSACLPNQLPGVVGTYGRQYYVDVPAGAPLLRFVMISPALSFPDGVWSYAAGSPRFDWTAAAIDGARAAGIPWVVVGMHKSCVSAGQYTCDPGAALLNMLLAKKVDLVLTGHEHLYQRSKQLALGAACPALTPGSYTPGCVADADDDLVKGAGTVVASVGTGGVGLRDIYPDDPEYPYFAATSGANQNPTYGVIDVSVTADALTAVFRRASGGTFTDAFTITRDSTPNTPPTAAFTPSCTDLACRFDGAASADPDGTIVGYAWDFGDGTQATGVQPSHTYTAAGTYPVTLTVTDDDGALGTLTQQVAVTAPTVVTYASDDFNRTVSNGLGSAPVGGPWSISSTASNYSVSGGQGRITLPAPGGSRAARLNAVSAGAVDLRAVIATDKPTTGNGVYASLIGRRISSAGEYRMKARVQASGAVGLTLVRTNSIGAETALLPELTVTGVSYAMGDRLNLRFQVTGTSPTQLRAKVWEVGAAEPESWQMTATDNTVGMQSAGSVGLYIYLSGSTSNAPLTVLVDDVLATMP